MSFFNKRALPWFLIAAGLLLASTGLRDIAGSYWGRWRTAQHDARIAPAVAVREFPSGFVGELRIPRLQSSMLVVDATKSQRALRRGPGYIAGSGAPGGAGNCIIAGHRDLHFRILKDIRAGDEITIDSPAGRFAYRVMETDVVEPTADPSLQAEYPEQLTLITCYPFYYVGPAPKRFLVKAALEKASPQG